MTGNKSIMYSSSVAAAADMIANQSAAVTGKEMTVEQKAALSAWLYELSIANGYTVYANTVVGNTSQWNQYASEHISGNFIAGDVEGTIGFNNDGQAQAVEGRDFTYVGNDGESDPQGKIGNWGNPESFLGTLVFDDDVQMTGNAWEREIGQAQTTTKFINTNDTAALNEFVQTHPEYYDIIDTERNLDEISETGEKLVEAFNSNVQDKGSTIAAIEAVTNNMESNDIIVVTIDANLLFSTQKYSNPDYDDS